MLLTGQPLAVFFAADPVCNTFVTPLQIKYMIGSVYSGEEKQE